MGKLPVSEIEKILGQIPPSELNYTEWRNVVFSAKSAGADMETVRSWSENDGRYDRSGFNSTWNSTDEIGGVTVGTMIWEAQKRGYSLPAEFSQDDRKSRKPSEESSLDPWRLPPPPKDTDISRKTETDSPYIRFLKSLFLPGDRVQVVTRTNDKGKPLPDTVSLPLTDLLSEEGQRKIAQAANKDAGVWVRFNPLSDAPKTGKAFGDADVTAFRYALIESDELPKDEQQELIQRLRLPVAAVLDSGNKSIHALVKIGAKNKAEYDKKVSMLYATCKRFGLEPDKNCKNPSRMCRLPGFQRAEGMQTLLWTERGCETFEDWRIWIDGQTDKLSVSLPDIVSFADVSGDKLPSRKPPLIADILRCGHVGLVTGASKMGKTFLLMELAIAVATGGQWLGHGCKKGRVLYCDFELDKVSFPNRIQDQITVLGADYSEVQLNLDIMCLRGCLPTQEQFRHDLSILTQGKGYSLIIIDPVYKLLQGDENAADAVSQMFSYVQGVAVDTGAAVVLCHHHSKGGQAGKNSMDRGSGSGAFAREPDCLIDMLELELTDTVREMYGFGDKPTVAFQLEYALREFPPHEKEYGFFRYPVHIMDSKALLKDARTAREAFQNDTKRKNSKAAKQSYRELFAEVWKKLSPRGRPSADAFIAGCRELGVPVSTSDDAIKRSMRSEGYTIGKKKEVRGLVINTLLEDDETEDSVDE